MMRVVTVPRLLAVALVALACLTMGTPAFAEPAAPEQVNIVVFAYVDVAGPACNLAYDTEDQDFARSNPLPPMTFVLRDPDGNELGRQDTTALVELQRARFSNVATFASYTLSLETPPAGWQQCANEASSRTITQADITLGQARANYHFFVPGNETPVVPTNTPVGPTATTAPGLPTATMAPGLPTATLPPWPWPTAVPSTEPSDGGEGEEEPASQGGAVQPAAPAVGAAGTMPGGAGMVAYVNPPAGTGKLAMIKGVAFVDENGDGAFGAGEPALNDLEVHLHGGGLAISQITMAPGTFSFEALGDGQYDVFINPGPEWTITTAQKYVVTVRGNIVTGIDFGLRRGGVVVAGATVHEVAGTGIRLPATGVMDVPRAGVLGGLAALLGILGLVGLTAERWKNRREL